MGILEVINIKIWKTKKWNKGNAINVIMNKTYFILNKVKCVLENFFEKLHLKMFFQNKVYIGHVY